MKTIGLLTAGLCVLDLTLTASAGQRCAHEQRKVDPPPLCAGTGSGAGARSIPAPTPDRSLDPRWTDAEAVALWNEFAPASARGKNLRPPLRTRHYIVLTDSSSGDLLAREMEKTYARIREIYPFTPTQNARLLPILIFRTPDEYRSFLIEATNCDAERAERTKGVACGEWYATWYESPGDKVHVHEATHQIFANRLGLKGGGSWFQEGVAEYVSTSRNDRNAVAHAIAAGDTIGLRELMGLTNLLDGAATGSIARNAPVRADAAQDRYVHAALFVEFLRESSFGKSHFHEFVKRMGNAPANDLAAIENVLREIYGEGIETIEARFRKYCRKR